MCREEDTEAEAEAEAIGISRKYIYWKSVEVGFLEHTHHTERREKRPSGSGVVVACVELMAAKEKGKKEEKVRFRKGKACVLNTPIFGSEGKENTFAVQKSRRQKFALLLIHHTLRRRLEVVLAIQRGSP